MFTLLAIVTFGTLLSKIFQETSFQKRMPYSLLFLLYLIAFSTLKIWLDARYELKVFIVTAFIIPAVWFPIESVWLYFQLVKKENQPFQDLKKNRGPYAELIAACRQLSDFKMGAILVIERQMNLSAWADKGIAVQAQISKELIFSIFTPPGALHDGAAIIRKDRIASAGVIVPLTKNTSISKDLGTRHRAAVGMSEATDALCLIVSEETGAISLADRGALYYDIETSHLPEILGRALKFKLDRPRAEKSLQDLMRV